MAEGDVEGSREGEEADSRNGGEIICKEEVCDDEPNIAALNTNYDSSDGAIPNYRCDRCEYEGVSHASLLSHAALCPSRSKLFECDVCQMKFSNSANMRRHKMRHSGVKPYECRICEKRFFRKDHLQEHMTTHAKAFPFKCPICPRGFQRQIAMRAHFQNEHVLQGDAPVKICPLCEYKAGSMKNLRVHFFNRHGIDLDQPVCSNGSGSDTSETAAPPMHFLTPQVELSLSPPPHQQVEEDLPESPQDSPESATDPNTPISSSTADTGKMEPVHLRSILSSQTCQFCHITFPDSTLYFLHKGCHSESSPWRCNICGDQTANVYDFNSHLLSKNHQ